MQAPLDPTRSIPRVRPRCPQQPCTQQPCTRQPCAQQPCAQQPFAEPRTFGPRAAGERGFTLVELLVALTAGLIVAGGAFALAKNAMTSFQEETRIAASQMGASLGLARMTADLQRAGYMASPNVALDPRICRGTPRASVPFQALSIVDGGSDASFGMTGLDPTLMGYDAGAGNEALGMPDAVAIAGNMTSAEQFEYRMINAGTVYLSVDRGPIQRAFEDLGRDEDALAAVFRPVLNDGTPGSRFARIVEPSGKESYVRVTDATVTAPGGVLETATLTILNVTGGPVANDAGSDCGFVNRGVGLINPVSVVRYRVAQVCDNLADPTCAGVDTLFRDALRRTGADEVTGESTRAELVREEVLPASVTAGDTFALGLPLATAAGANGLASQELIAEFAVDLDFSVFHTPNNGADPPEDAPDLLLAQGAAVNAVPGQRVRSLRVRMGTRARVPDRTAQSPTGAMTRFELMPLAAVGNPNRWARMRTMQTEIQMPNLQAVPW